MKILLLIISLTLCFTAAHAETIYYDIVTGFKVGHATLKIEGPREFKGQKTILIVFKASAIKVNDEENIYLHPDTLKPLFVERIYNNEKISEDYFSDKNKILITKTVGRKTTKQVLKRSKDVENIYGFIYRYRKTGSFKMGDTVEFNIPTRNLVVQMMKSVTIDAAGQKYEALFMQSKPAKYKIWFDTSDKKIPLKISTIIGFASTTMVMTKYEE